MKNDLPQLKGECRFDYPLASLTWFKVGGPASLLFKPYDIEDLQQFLHQTNYHNLFVMGAGSNLIIRDGGYDGVAIKLGRNFTEIQLVDNKLKVGAGCLNFNLAQFCAANAITGFEFLVGIPGTIGGGVVMNAGSYGHEFKDIVTGIKALDRNGNIVDLSRDDITFNYRSSNLPNDLIIVEATFRIAYSEQEKIKKLMQEIQQKRGSTQPIKERTGGSTFANPSNMKAWELIDASGFRGYKLGGAGISDLHCNFMINYGNALASDLENLGELVRNRVFEDSGVMLEWEIKRIGSHAK